MSLFHQFRKGEVLVVGAFRMKYLGREKFVIDSPVDVVLTRESDTASEVVVKRRADMYKERGSLAIPPPKGS